MWYLYIHNVATLSSTLTILHDRFHPFTCLRNSQSQICHVQWILYTRKFKFSPSLGNLNLYKPNTCLFQTLKLVLTRFHLDRFDCTVVLRCSFSVNPVGGLMVSLLTLRVDDCGFDSPIRSSQRLRFAVRLLSTQCCGVRAKLRWISYTINYGEQSSNHCSHIKG